MGLRFGLCGGKTGVLDVQRPLSSPHSTVSGIPKTLLSCLRTKLQHSLQRYDTTYTVTLQECPLNALQMSLFCLV